MDRFESKKENLDKNSSDWLAYFVYVVFNPFVVEDDNRFGSIVLPRGLIFFF